LFKKICSTTDIETLKNCRLSPGFEFNPLSIFLSCYIFSDTSIYLQTNPGQRRQYNQSKRDVYVIE
jgi:hypothetical protein